jgi:fumarylacetoacetase
MAMQTGDGRKSWITSANETGSGFPLQGLPYCSFAVKPDRSVQIGLGIGAYVLDLKFLSMAGQFASLGVEVQAACCAERLNALMGCGPSAWQSLRAALLRLLDENVSTEQREIVAKALIPREYVQFGLPVDVGDYTDFYASLHHATNVGKLFRPEQPLMPNYAWVPIGYHGRASSLVVSGTEIRRPQGQFKTPGTGAPVFAPARQLDYEMELGAYIGVGNALGEPIAIAQAEEHIFGVTLLNDWSARDIQAWEAQPLGPFLGKNFATSVSPWVLPMEALEPFRVELAARDEGMPEPLPYLDEGERPLSAIDVTVEVYMSTPLMRKDLLAPVRISSGNAKGLYWSFAQMIAHHTSNGCNLRVGDLIASGTISGAEPGSEGCLLERTKRGTHALVLPNGEERLFLEEGDEIFLRGFCEREGMPRISLGECVGIVRPNLR